MYRDREKKRLNLSRCRFNCRGQHRVSFETSDVAEPGGQRLTSIQITLYKNDEFLKKFPNRRAYFSACGGLNVVVSLVSGFM